MRSGVRRRQRQHHTRRSAAGGGRQRVALGLLLGALLAGGLGLECGRGATSLRILEPTRDVVPTFQFRVAVRVPADAVFDRASGVELNGARLPVVPAEGEGTYEATIQPGFPLQDHNELVVRAEREGAELVARHRFVYGPPKARVLRIEREDQLLPGPLSHGRVGDWMLENGEARFVVQDVAQRDLYSIGQFGGNLIDAALVDRPTPDNFLEIQPMVNVESVVNAQTVEIVNDGQDGTAAILRTCGPDDLLDFVNPSSLVTDAGLSFPALADDRDLEVEGCTEFRLEPEVAWIELETTIFNNQPVGAMPADLPLAVGDWINGAGELEQLTTPGAGLGEALLGAVDVLQYLGYGEATGVDYAFTTVEVPSLPGIPSTFFTQTGVSVILHNANVVATLLGTLPPFVVPRGGSLSFRRYFAVGDGSGATGPELAQAVKGRPAGALEGCVTVGGEPLAGSRVSVFQASNLATAVRTDGGECPNYRVSLAAGDYEVRVGRDGALYEGGAAVPPAHPVHVPAGASATAPTVDLPAGALVRVRVVDENGEGIPGRVTVVGFDPSPVQTRPGPFFPGVGGSTLALLEDPGDRPPFGVVASGYADPTGWALLDVEPGSYELFASRGTEYSLFRAPLALGSGEVVTIEAVIARVLATPGFVSSDFHVHGIASPDSRVSDSDRVRQFAGEGVENVIMTDHDAHKDLRPRIQALGFRGFLAATVGEEITTFDYGHFNAYPFGVDRALPSGGSTDFGKPAPPGMDFPAYGHFSGTPAEILDLARTQPTALPSTTAQVNHIDSHFVPLRIDTSVPGTITDGLDAAARLARRLDPAAGNLFEAFPALEVWNGASRGAQSEFLDERIGIWFNHLNKGLPTTAIFDTDTHTFADLRTAGARTWTASPADAPWQLDPEDVARAVDAGRAVGGQGVYVQARLVARDGSGGVADFRLDGDTQVVSATGDVDLEIHVQAPTWAPFDRILVYANAATEPVDPAAPYLFRPAPGQAQSFVEGDCDPGTAGDGDFDLDVVPVAGVAGAERLEAFLSVPFRGLVRDTWFVVLVQGTDGLCTPMFPVFAQGLSAASNATLADLLDGNRGEGGVMALGATNALYADVDGLPGFQPPNP